MYGLGKRGGGRVRWLEGVITLCSYKMSLKHYLSSCFVQ